MTTITVSLWVFALTIGIPGFCLLWLVGRLILKKRKSRKEKRLNMALRLHEDQSNVARRQFHNDLLMLQVDAVFNGLNAILETERIKIKTLLNNSGAMGFEPAAFTMDACAGKEMPLQRELTRDQHAADEIPADHDAAEGLVNETSDDNRLSQSELELAMKMRASRQRDRSRKLEAVA